MSWDVDAEHHQFARDAQPRELSLDVAQSTAIAQTSDEPAQRFVIGSLRYGMLKVATASSAAKPPRSGPIRMMR